MLNKIVDNMVVQSVKKELSNNKRFMEFEDGYLSGDAFRTQVIYKANAMGMSVNEIVTEILSINGCN